MAFSINGINLSLMNLKNGTTHVANYKGGNSKRKAIGGRKDNKIPFPKDIVVLYQNW